MSWGWDGGRVGYLALPVSTARRLGAVAPVRRGGIFQTDFVFRVRAKGYIEAVFIVDPHNIPLPPSTVAWPFADTTVHTSLPATIAARLKPAKPVLLKALTSSDKLIRDTNTWLVEEDTEDHISVGDYGE